MALMARELLANDMVQEFRIFSRENWDPDHGIGLILPRVVLAHTPTVEAFDLASPEVLKELSRQRHLALRDADLPIILDYFRRPEVLARRAAVGLGRAHRRGTGIPGPGPERPLQPQHLPGPVPLPGPGERRELHPG